MGSGTGSTEFLIYVHYLCFYLVVLLQRCLPLSLPLSHLSPTAIYLSCSVPQQSGVYLVSLFVALLRATKLMLSAWARACKMG